MTPVNRPLVFELLARLPEPFTYAEAGYATGLAYDKTRGLVRELVAAGDMERVPVVGPYGRHLFQWVDERTP